ncbi:MAG: large conductance mechanosensitive channel protein MscL [Firmicutes bacterium]|nr:large conductance mechanosensitive channel protein MscL [Bacillota bacterium]MBR6585449.1 large conductance mechanosensitive channel protein MscL [Bacillota bacterium]
MKKFLEEFKAFIAKGNVMTMAVGIIIGGAFTSIVNSLVNDVITPLLGIIIGGINFTGIKITVGSAELLVGNFIQAVITFLLTAFVIFWLVKFFNKLTEKKKEEPAPEPEKEPEPAPTPEDIELLREIRDLLKAEK